MLELFLNPWSMVAGAALVSVPIIIHLINRMRFKRVRWAAMEFILKAQKRMKRKLIFQQLLLLLLRCLLVFLIGMLVGRFLGFNPADSRETRTTAHIVILDDSPSMGDFFRDDSGQQSDAFEQAKKVLIEQISPAAAQATTPQTLDLILLSKPDDIRSFGRINDTSIETLKSTLATTATTAVRGKLVDALKKAKQALPAAESGGDVAQVIHVLSDFRSSDWEADGNAIKAVIEELAAAKVKVHLTDSAHPFRKDDKRPPLHHDNIGILELKPSRLVAARFEPLEFTLRVKNAGAAELKDVRFAISVNGDDGKGLSVQFPTLPGNQEVSTKFNLSFDRIADTDKPLDRFSLVTARMEAPEAGGLKIDNVRHAVVEVREKLPMLVVDGRPADREKKNGDSFYLQRVFTNAIGGFAWTPGSASDLEKDLRAFSSVLLLNVPSLNDAAVKNLEQYVRDGGGVGVFLGPDVKPDDYNQRLYADGKGLLPVPLPDRPTEALPDEKRIERMFSPMKKLLLRDKSLKQHPAVAAIYSDDRGQLLKDDELERFFKFVYIGRYWPIKRIGKWRDDRSVNEIYCLPNEQPMGDFDKPATDFLAKLPLEQPKYAKYKPLLEKFRSEIRATALSTKPLFELAVLFDQLLADQRTEGDPNEALLREFWAMPENAELRTEAARLRDAVKYGDPLYFAKSFGRGRVTLITTTAGETWNDWASSPPGNASFAPILCEMERYLSGGTAEQNPNVGEPYEIKVDTQRYKNLVNRTFLSFDPLTTPPQRGVGNVTTTDLKLQQMSTTGTQQVLSFTEATKPGGYVFTLTQLKTQTSGSESAETPEYLGLAFNLDAKRESELKRAAREDVLQQAPGAELHSVDDAAWVDSLKNKKTDWTEGGWIFLALLLVLIAEQMLAVKLSFNRAVGEPGT